MARHREAIELGVLLTPSLQEAVDPSLKQAGLAWPPSQSEGRQASVTSLRAFPVRLTQRSRRPPGPSHPPLQKPWCPKARKGLP